MKATDKPEFLRILTGLAAIKPGKPLTPEGLDVYWLALSEWGLAEFKQAASVLAKSVEFMPNPYHFEQLRKSGRDTAGEAFHKAMLLARRAPPREIPSLTSGDPSIDAAVRACGGFHQLAMCDSDKLGFLERRFAEHYDTIAAADYTREALPQMGWEPRKKLPSGPQPLREIAGNL